MLSIVPKAPLPETPEQMVSYASELEALPVVAQRVLGILQDERTTIDTIADELGTDQALASAVLRYANSAQAMPNRPIANLRQALARIGRRAVSEVLLRACTGAMLDRGLPPYALPRRVAWRHSATASVAAKQLAVLLDVAEAGEASVAGLLHDVGKMVLTSVVPEAAAEAVSIARSRRLLVWQAEVEVLGFHHGAVGAALLRSWSLPEVVSDAIAHHHEPERTSNPLATLLYLADAAAHAVGAAGGGGACAQPEWSPELAHSLGATPAQCQQFMDELHCVEEGGL